MAQAFKGTLALGQVQTALLRGLDEADVAGTVVPGSDGGDGLLEALAGQVLRTSPHQVTGPLGEPVEATIGWLDDRTAVVESRMACGLTLVPPARRDPERATTRGVAELIGAAAAGGARTVFVGLGGSATMDGGAGLAEVWAGHPPEMELVGLCDVLVPLSGASAFAAQKGADRAMAARLAARLADLAAADPGVAALPGAGAAGGLGFGLVRHGGARLIGGADWVLDRHGFPAMLAQADLVLATEAAFDATSRQGKLAGRVLERAVRAGRRAGLLAPTATAVPEGVLVESGGGTWSAETLRRRAVALVRRALGT